MLNAGIIGMGAISKYYLKGLKASSCLELKAICDTNPDFASRPLFKDYPFYEDYLEMIEKEGLDYVIISTPPKSHYEIALNSMKRGVNVIIEKPAVLNMKEYDDLLKYAADHNLIFEVSYHWQNGAEVIEFNKHYDARKITEIHIHVDDPYSDDGININDDKIKLEGAFIDSGVNALSLINLWLPFEQISINRVDTIKCPKTNLPIYAFVELVIDGVLSTIEVDWRNGINNKESYVIYEGRRIDIKHSLQMIIDGDEIIDCKQMERLETHYYNYFKNYQEGEIKKQQSYRIHSVLFEVVRRYL